MAGVSRIAQAQIEEAESIALAAAAILVELNPLTQTVTALKDQYSLERLQRIAQAAEAIRRRAIAQRPRNQLRTRKSIPWYHCLPLEFSNE